jgi:6-phosphogluconolactonase
VPCDTHHTAGEVQVVTKVVPGLLIATPDAAQVAREACARMTRAIHDALKERGSAFIALSGGSSPVEAYRCLAQQPIDWKNVHIYWVDERAVPPEQERSNYGAAKKALLDSISVPSENVHRMPAEQPDLAKAAMEYETLLRDTVKQKLGGLPALDLVVLGIGDDGHTASLFPGEGTVSITDRLVADVPARNGREARLTLTAPLLENGRASVIIALGKSKHAPLERIWATSGDLQQTPARVIRGFRGAITWVIDRAAGGMG